MVLVTSVLGLMWSKSSSMSRQTGVFSPMKKEQKHVLPLKFSFITIWDFPVTLGRVHVVILFITNFLIPFLLSVLALMIMTMREMLLHTTGQGMVTLKKVLIGLLSPGSSEWQPVVIYLVTCNIVLLLGYNPKQYIWLWTGGMVTYCLHPANQNQMLPAAESFYRG